jgi:hypothetical protein
LVVDEVIALKDAENATKKQENSGKLNDYTPEQ